MLEIVKQKDGEVKDENCSIHTENLTTKCMPTLFTSLMFPTYNNTKTEIPSTDTNTHNNTVTSLPSTSKSDTYILNITQKQQQYRHKSDTDINKTTPDQHFIDIPYHISTNFTALPNHTLTEDLHTDTDDGVEPDDDIEPVREITQRTADSFDRISAQYDDADVDLDQLVKINIKWCKDSDINLDELVDNNIPDDKEELLQTLTPVPSADSFHQLAGRYEDTGVDLDQLVTNNLPYCDSENINLDMLVESNDPDKVHAASNKNVKALIHLFDKP